MSEELLKAFMGTVKADISLQQKLKLTKSQQSLVSMAEEVGFDISAHEFKRTQVEISELDLESVAGG